MTTYAAQPTRRRWSRVDAALAELVRVIMDDAWTAKSAAEALSASTGGDRWLLRRLRARVWRNIDGRPSPAAERALATLSAALGDTAT